MSLITQQEIDFLFGFDDIEDKTGYDELTKKSIEIHMTKLNSYARRIKKTTSCPKQFILNCLQTLGVSISRGWDKTIETAKRHHYTKLIAAVSIMADLFRLQPSI